MKCPECQTENPDNSRFCKECGSNLEIKCPACSKANPPDSKFCTGCGHDLRTPPTAAPPRDLSFDERLAKIQKYLPSGLAEKVLSQKDRIEGEKRQVTIMFVDMKGFTPLTEKLGPEETFTLMDQVFEILIHKVHDYEGTVNELRGDGMLAFFGAPIALEDAPQRAIRSSLAIHREMTRFNDKIKADRRIPPVLLRIGINTGPVVIGTVGNDLRVQFTAVGDTINMAARMEQTAEPGTTYVTQDTFKLTEGFFRFEALGQKQVKGKEEPLNVYRVIAPSSRRTRFDVAAERGLTRFVGRERELAIMLDAYERAKDGRGQAVSLVGEAGVGKSRLLYEFRKAMANEDVTFLEGKCLSYSRGTAYHPIIDILKANFDVQEGDGDAEIRNKITIGLKLLDADEPSTLPYFLELLSVKDSGIDKIQMSPEGKKDRIIQAIKSITLKGCEIRPLIMAIEDLHWMDKNSEDVSKYLLESIPAARILLLFTYRPEYVQTWGGKSYHGQVKVNRLSDSDSPIMASHVLGSNEIDSDLEELILEKTEGVPFFIEEFIKSLSDLNAIDRKDNKYHLSTSIRYRTIPSTIQDVIMARVDRLPEGAKEVLQIGSVVEREFSYDLMNEVTGLPEQELLSRLSIVKEAELLYERGIYPQSAYVFKHALTREVVYDSLLTEKKKKLHEAIGDAMEDLLKENIDEHYAVLAGHYIKAENWEKGAEYSRSAGKEAGKKALINDALAHGKETVAALERLPQSEKVEKKLIDARTFLGRVYLLRSDVKEAKQAVAPVFEPAVRHNYMRRLSQVHCIIGVAKYLIEDDFPGSFEHLNDALRIARELGDVLSLAFGSFHMACAMGFECRYDEAFVHFQEMLRINEAAGSVWGTSLGKSFLSVFICMHGKIDAGFPTSREALLLAEQSGDILSKSYAYVSHGVSCYCKGSLHEAQRHLLKGAALSVKVDNPTYLVLAQWYLGELRVDTGGYERAAIHYLDAVRVCERFDMQPSARNFLRMALARVRVLNDDRVIELETLYTYVDQNRVKMYEGWLRRYLGEILLILDNQHFPEAQHWIEEAIEADDRNGMRWHLARDIAVYADLFKRKGDIFQAKERMGKAIEIYKECGADGWVTKAEEDLAKLQ